MRSGLGVRLTVALLSCTMRDVSWSRVRNNVSPVARNSPVTRGPLRPKEKSKRKPRQFGMDPVALVLV
jgi:hypothetical protein